MISVVQENRSKNAVIQYELESTMYEIQAYYNQKRSEIGVKSICQEAAEETVA